MKAIVKGFHQHPPALSSGLGHAQAFLLVARQRFLAQHVFARLERANRPLGVQTVGQGVVDHIDVGIGKQRRVTVEGPRKAVFGRELARALAIARGHRFEHDAFDDARGFHQRHGRNARSTEYAEAEQRS